MQNHEETRKKMSARWNAYMPLCYTQSFLAPDCERRGKAAKRTWLHGSTWGGAAAGVLWLRTWAGAAKPWLGTCCAWAPWKESKRSLLLCVLPGGACKVVGRLRLAAFDHLWSLFCRWAQVSPARKVQGMSGFQRASYQAQLGCAQFPAHRWQLWGFSQGSKTGR